MYVDPSQLNCMNCFKPTLRRPANFKAKDEYECYTENYVKCFWELCDYQTSTESFVSKPKEKVITQQPRRGIKLPKPNFNCPLSLDTNREKIKEGRIKDNRIKEK